MHILYEIEHLASSGGIERILTDKANYIVENWGWEVTIVVLLDEESVTFYPVSPKVHIHYLHVRSKGIRMCVEALWKLNKLVDKLRPDVYVTFQTIGAISCMIRTHNTPTIYEAHGARNFMQHQLAMSMAEKSADCIVTLTNDNVKRYSRSKNVVVIPNFTYVKSQKKIDYSKKHCIALGRLDFQKNYPGMIEIWKTVKVSHPDWILDIYGEGVERPQLQKMIDNYCMSDSVVLHGLTNNPIEAYYTASIYLMTSLFEGLPMVLIEAMVCGLSCVSFDCDDGPREIIEDGKTGYLIPYDDDQMFIEKLSSLMDDEALRRRMGEAAKASSQRFQPAPIMAQWLKLFTELMR